MSDYLNQFLLFHAIFYRFAEMKSQLVRTIQSNQRGDRYQTAITF